MAYPYRKLLKPRLGARPYKGHRLSKGLVGCWLLNESAGNNVFDVSGNRNIGTLVNSPKWIGNGLNFVAASSQYGSASVPPSISTTLYTIVVDFKTSGSGTARPINIGNTGETQHFTALDANVGTDFTFWFSTDIAKSIVYTKKVPLANTRYMLAGVSNGTTFKAIYIDGVLAESSVEAVAAPTPWNIVGIGALIRDTFVYSDCDIYSISIYNRALTVNELVSLYIEKFSMFERKVDPILASMPVAVVPCSSTCVIHGWLEDA